MKKLLIHAEDDIKVNAIRHGKLVEVYWNELTDDERRVANNAMFQIYNY